MTMGSKASVLALLVAAAGLTAGESARTPHTAGSFGAFAAIPEDRVDIEASGVLANGTFAAMDLRTVKALLGAGGEAVLKPPDGGSNRHGGTVHYRIAFREPVEVGSMFVRPLNGCADGWSFFCLAQGAEFPGNPAQTNDWIAISSVRMSDAYDCVLQAGVKTRAVLCVHRFGAAGKSGLSRWRIVAARVQNLTPLAIAQAEEFPRGTDPAVVTRGGEWVNTAPDDEGRIGTRPISSVAPLWFILSWPEPREFVGVRVKGSFSQYRLHAWTGPEDGNPAVSQPDQWRRLSGTVIESCESDRESEQFVAFPGTKTKALRLSVLETKPPNRQIVSISQFSAFADIGHAPAAVANTQEASFPPFQVAYTLGTGGVAALVIEDAAGRRIRNMFAQIEKTAGGHAEPWDLRDEDGNLVPPGQYRWRAICAPRLELIYQFTAYPNVEQHSPASTPWNRGPSDGWLANHGNQCAVCVVKDRVCIGAGGTEGGHAFIETDFNGAKLWGTHDGVNHLFSDGTMLFCQSGDRIRRWETADRTWRDVLALKPTLTRKGELVGRAAKDGQIWLAWWGEVPYLENAADVSDVDGDRCLPPTREIVRGAGDYGMDIYPRRDFLSLFRLGGHISGEPRTFIFIESTEGKGPKQFAMLVFTRPVPIGSLVFPRHEDASNIIFQASILKPGARMPPDPRRESDWTRVDLGGISAWNCVPLPPGAMTQALRLTFVREGEELLAEAESSDAGTGPGLDVERPDAGDADHSSVGAGPAATWKGRIEGMRLLRRRFRSALQDAVVRVNSGVYDAASGEWDAKRADPITPDRPGIFVMEWAEPRKIRGLAIKEIDGRRTEIDVFTGRKGEKVDIEGPNGWVHVASYEQPRRNFYQPDPGNNARARYLDGMVDFGREWETRAVRLRVVEQWSEKSGRPEGVREDRGGTKTDPCRCRIYGAVPLEYLGGEPPCDPLAVRRLCVYDGQTGRLLAEHPSEVRGPMAFHPSGGLFAVDGTGVVRVNIETAEKTPYVTDLEDARLLAFDRRGRLYVYDHGPDRRVVRVYDENGRFRNNIGRPGPRQAGPYEPTSFGELCAIAVDEEGEFLWAVYPHEDPRRVIKMRTDGTFVQDYLGNTHYGGGGVLDPWDKTRLWYKNVLFRVDWEQGIASVGALVSLAYHEASPWSDTAFRHSWRPIVCKGRTYLVSEGSVGSVYVYDEKSMTVRMASALGKASAFPYLKTPEVLKHLGGRPLGGFSFVWTDRNSDGCVKLEEVEFTPEEDPPAISRFCDDLTALSGNRRYEVAEFLADGSPLYRMVRMPFSAALRFSDGSYFRFANGFNEWLDASGRRRCSYRAGFGMDGLKIYPWSPGVVDLQFGISGHAVAHAGDLGEFFVVHANNGQMNIWTSDGFLAGNITRHMLDPEARGWPAEHGRGTRMDGLTLGQEHFHHYFCKTGEDDKYYIVAGHSWMSVIEVRGFDRFRRASGSFEVTPQALRDTAEWERAKARRAAYARPRVMHWRRKTEDWESAEPVASIPGMAALRACYDAAFLYLRWDLEENAGRLLENRGDDYRRCFKTGAAVDIQIGTDSSADPNRSGPAAGDLRIVVVPRPGKPFAVLYRPIAPGAAKDESWSTSTPAGGKVDFDQVTILQDAKVEVKAAGEHSMAYVVAAVPLNSLGWAPAPRVFYRADWGIMTTRDGFNTSGRWYWANTSATGVSDEPTEARLEPALWGYLLFEEDGSGPASPSLTPARTEVDEDIEELLEE
jgi:hypothetical protein